MTTLESLATLRALFHDAETDASRPTVCQIRAGQDALAIVEEYVRRIERAESALTPSDLATLRARAEEGVRAEAISVAIHPRDLMALLDAVGRP